MLCDTFLRRREIDSAAFLLREGCIASGCGTDTVGGSDVVSFSGKSLLRIEIGSAAFSFGGGTTAAFGSDLVSV